MLAHLEKLIVERQLYRKPRRADDLAGRTGLQSKDISWAFNVGAKASFNDCVNGLRVAALGGSSSAPVPSAALPLIRRAP